MGIQGLLPLISSVIEVTTLESCRGKSVAVDGYAWLHKSVYGCSEELFKGNQFIYLSQYIY